MNEAKKALRRKALGEPGKIVVRLNPEQWARAIRIRDEYGYKSLYQIDQYLWACFLRVADPEHEEKDDPVPEEIEAMFGDFAQAEKRFEYVKPKRKINHYELNRVQGQLPLELDYEEKKQ